jgi:hypothetical protein
MTTSEIAAKLADYCKQGKFEEAQKELYAEDAVSTEPHATMAFDKVVHGLPGILEKGQKFMSMVEKVYSCTVSEPMVSGNSFAFVLNMDIEMKGQGRSPMAEICVYEVKDGKIASEQFFF